MQNADILQVHVLAHLSIINVYNQKGQLCLMSRGSFVVLITVKTPMTNEFSAL